MKTVFAKVALAALCATALTAVSHTAHAGTVTITGLTLNAGPNPLYGTSTDQNNVINANGVTPTGSILYDPTGPNLTSSTPWVMNGIVTPNVGGDAYSVRFFFTGSESGDTITLNAPGLTPFTEGNQNNNAYAGGPPLTSGSYQDLGQAFYGPGAALSFALSWPDGGGGSVDNSVNQGSPGSGDANMLFSYVNPTVQGNGYTWLTTTPGDWFVFALNDNGGNDDNHDDFVGFAQVLACGTDGSGCAPQFTPIPAALPLFGSVLGGGFVAGVWRRRRKVVKA